MRKLMPVVFTVVIVLISIYPSSKGKFELEELYKEARFSLVSDYFQRRDYGSLTLQEKLLYIECLARTAHGKEAEDKMSSILSEFSSSCEVLIVAGIVCFSNGRLKDAEKYIGKALMLDSNHMKAILTKVMLLLYNQEFNEAEQLYEKLENTYLEWKDTYFFYLVGIEVYRAGRNSQRLSSLYEERSKKYKKINKRYSESLKDNAELFKKTIKKRMYHVKTGSDKAILSFAEPFPDNQYITLPLQLKNKDFKVILDSGNAIGWMIHSRELKKLLNSENGGRAFVRIGRETGLLDGYQIYTDRIDFGEFSLRHLTGHYVPKPRPNYHDANLNPTMIRDRVVTLDFVSNRLILRSKEKFDEDLILLLSQHPENICRLPWYGYKQPYVPVIINDERNGLAMIETGAEDIALRLSFARKLQKALEPEVKYLVDGRELRYFKTPIKVSLGKFPFERKAADVWPFNRFYDWITGLGADVIIGPLALRGQMNLSFDPFDKKIVLSSVSF